MSQLYENAAGKKCRNKSKAFRPKIRRSHILELAHPPKYEKKEISSFIGEHSKAGRSPEAMGVVLETQIQGNKNFGIKSLAANAAKNCYSSAQKAHVTLKSEIRKPAL